MWKTVARAGGYGLAGIAFFILLFLGLSSSSESLNKSEFAQRIGLATVAGRANAIQHAIRWEIASWPVFHGSDILDPDYTLYGNLYSLHPDGTLMFRYFDPETKKTRYARAELANIEIQKLMPTAKRVQKMSYADAIIEVYDERYVIIWIDREAFNRDLVRDGLAIPEDNPNTPIKGRIISDYYWHKAGEGG